ncbi:unnamed protein product [Fraxinus pennsylvanica]|uniref:MCM C-terminal AAA(+) ATPase domain-containing protein n=1 Tax=Fraxinus pennsylvanica TaxID=56036 RepID=A0AAD1Z2D1_9LAMI|nr:unnamed protein product [Fraxinus pennsylvanica]
MQARIIADTYLEAMSITHFKKKKVESELRGDEEEQIARLAEDGDIYNKLAQSLAPEIYGHEDIKKALLLLLIGAPHQNLKDGMKLSDKLASCPLCRRGSYDLRRTPAENINLPPAYLSKIRYSVVDPRSSRYGY